MSSRLAKDTKLKTIEIAELALLGALCFAGKLALSFIPNVHPVALMLIAVTSVYGVKAFYMCFVYIALEILVYGFGIWSISYLYVWPLLVLSVLLLRSHQSRLVLAFAALLHGLSFGALCSIPYLVSGGLGSGLSYWVSGIPFDIIHGISNGIIVYFLAEPVTALTEKLHKRDFKKINTY